jgi:addiction module HigA family antidote
MQTPLHPGRVVKEECLKPLRLSVKRVAEILGVSRQALNNVVNEDATISASMALRLEEAFGGAAETWLRMQANYDLACARRARSGLRVQSDAPELAGGAAR